MNVQFPTYQPNTNEIIEMKLLAGAVGMTTIPSFYNAAGIADTSYNSFFFKNLNFLIAEKNVNDGSKLINIGATEISNQFADEYGY